jgi:hypothetical protein
MPGLAYKIREMRIAATIVVAQHQPNQRPHTLSLKQDATLIVQENIKQPSIIH